VGAVGWGAGLVAKYIVVAAKMIITKTKAAMIPLDLLALNSILPGDFRA
jgi:hypothetical protein